MRQQSLVVGHQVGEGRLGHGGQGLGRGVAGGRVELHDPGDDLAEHRVVLAEPGQPGQLGDRGRLRVDVVVGPAAGDGLAQGLDRGDRGGERGQQAAGQVAGRRGAHRGRAGGQPPLQLARHQPVAGQARGP
jgi:hypothetical protein